MPRPLSLHAHGAGVYTRWKRTADPEDVPLVEEALQRVSAGTWLGWRHSRPDRADEKVTVISLRPDLLVSVVFDTDEPGMFDVLYIGPHPDNWPDGSRPLGGC
jgi:hypothetical protein